MIPSTFSSKLESERRFFFYMAIAVAVAVTVVAGFGSQLVTGRVWFTDFPWQVHVLWSRLPPTWPAGLCLGR